MKIGGLDIGTTGCKLTVFDEKGALLDKAYRDYPVTRNSKGHTVDAAVILKGVLEVISEIAAKYHDLRGIGVTSFGESFVMTDDEGVPLAPVMLYTDPRGRKEREQLEDKLGSFHMAEISGLHPHEMYSLPKLMWIREHQPDVFKKAKHVFLIEDFIVFSLTKVAQIDYSMATRTLAFDVRSLSWSDEIFDTAGVDKSLFSKPVPTGTPAGYVTSDVARETGISKDTLIVSISQDQVSAAVGAGVFSPDRAVDGAGTVECLTPVYDSLPDMKPMYDGNYAVVPYVIPGSYVCYAFSYTGGALIQWCVDNLAKKEKELAREQGIAVNAYLENEYRSKRGSDDIPSGLLVLPHFAGAATPYMDTGSRGVIVGLTTDSSAADIYRGCMEGVVYEMVLNSRHLRPSGVRYSSIAATGGGARSRVWMQMKADMLDMPITALETVDAGTVGSAMLTGVALGLFKDLDAAAAEMVIPTDTYEPRKAMHEAYMEIYERYAGLYEAVRPLM